MGESLFWASAKLFSTAGSHILFVFLLLAGVLLLTGASIAGVVQRHARGRGHHHQRRACAAGLATRGHGSPRPARPDPGRVARPPEPEDREPVVRATHVEAPALDGTERYPDVYGEDGARARARGRRGVRALERPRARAGARARARAAEPEIEEPELTPMGNRRSAVTESDDIDYRMPKPSFLKRSNGAQKVDTKGIERDGRRSWWRRSATSTWRRA